MLLMYANDTVIFANDEKNLQNALNILSEYCDLWKLKVNSKKTKVTIFGRAKYRKQTQFWYKGETLEITDTYKYLGILFNYNGSFKVGMKELFDQSSRAMFSLPSKCRTLNLPIDIQMDLFDKTIIPIITYGSEIWGYEKLDLIEKLQITFCKRVLQLKKNTGNMFLYGELGRYPLSIVIQTRMINYWARLNNSKNSKLNVILYNSLLELHNKNIYRSKWILQIKSIFDACGMSNVFENPTNFNKEWLKHAITRKLKDQFLQTWQENLNKHSIYSNYKSYKNTLELE